MRCPMKWPFCRLAARPIARLELRHLTGPLAAGVVLAAFWILMLASLRDKCLTADEPGHAAAGATYWKFNDYRLDPENGNLPQRLIALPLLLRHYPFPLTDASELTKTSDAGQIGYDWFYLSRSDAVEKGHRLGSDWD